MSEEKKIFSFEISSAFFMKPLMDLEKLLTRNLCISINNEYVKLLQTSVTKLYTKTVFETSKLKNFEFNGEGTIYYIVPTAALHNAFISLKRNEDILIGSTSKSSIFVTTQGSSSREGNHENIGLIYAEFQTEFTEKVINFTESSMKKMITNINSTSLSSLLTAFHKAKSNNLDIVQYPSGLSFNYSSSFGSQFMENFGTINTYDTPVFVREDSSIVQSSPLIKKSNTFSLEEKDAGNLNKACKIIKGLISFYYEDGKPLKLLIPLNGYGYFEIYIFKTIK